MPTTDPELTTERLRLRRLQPADAPLIAPLVNDWEVARWTSHIPHPYTVQMADEFIAAQAEAPSNGSRGVRDPAQGRRHAGRLRRPAPRIRLAPWRARLLGRQAILGQRLCQRGGARRRRLRLQRAEPGGAGGRRGARQPRLAPRAGQVRLHRLRRARGRGAGARLSAAVDRAPPEEGALARAERRPSSRC